MITSKNSPKGTPELEALISALVFVHCKLDALVLILQRKNIIVSLEEVENQTSSLFENEYISRRQQIIDSMTDPDVHSTLKK